MSTTPPEGNGRVSVSEDKLYRALAEFELRISKRIDEALAPVRKDVDGLKSRQNKVAGALVLAAGVLSVLGPVLVK